MKYKVITTEMHSATYIVDANSEEEAIQSARLSDDPMIVVYNETLRDRDSMYVVKLPDYEKGEQVADVVEKWGKHPRVCDKKLLDMIKKKSLDK